jgi:hypothetical protein
MKYFYKVVRFDAYLKRQREREADLYHSKDM